MFSHRVPSWNLVGTDCLGGVRAQQCEARWMESGGAHAGAWMVVAVMDDVEMNAYESECKKDSLQQQHISYSQLEKLLCSRRARLVSYIPKGGSCVTKKRDRKSVV